MSTSSFKTRAAALLLSCLAVTSIVNAELEAPRRHGARGHGRMIKKRDGFPNIFPTPPGPAQTPSTPANVAQDPAAGDASSSVTPVDSSTPTPSTTPKVNDPLQGVNSFLSNVFNPLTHSPTTSVPTSAAPSSSIVVSLAHTNISSAPTSTRTSTTQATSSTPTSTTIISTDAGHTYTSVVVATVGAAASQSPASNPVAAANLKSVTIARGTVVALVAVGGSIAAALLIWAGIRKWMFKSRSLKDRTNINWDPQADTFADNLESASSRRRPASEMSFGSNDAHVNTAYGSTDTRAPGQGLSHQAYAYQESHPSPLSSSPPMVENNLTRGASFSGAAPRHDDMYGGYEESYEDGMAPHHAAAGATLHYPNSGMPPAHQF